MIVYWTVVAVLTGVMVFLWMWMLRQIREDEKLEDLDEYPSWWWPLW